MQPNQLAAQPEHLRPTHNGDQIQYSDGMTALVWDAPGAVVRPTAGEDPGDPTSEYVNGLGQTDTLAILTTDSGNQYGVGSGLIINKKTGDTYETGALPDITIGEHLSIPGKFTTTRIRSVAVASGRAEQIAHLEQVDAHNPFDPLGKRIARTREQQYQQALEQRRQTMEKNINLLNTSELRGALGTAYFALLEMYPQLEDIEIVPVPEDSAQIASATPSWSSRSNGKHQVNLRIGDLPTSLRKYEEADQFTPSSKREIAKLYGIDESEVTPQLQYVTSFIHEFGHVLDYINAGSHEAYAAMRDQDRAATHTLVRRLLEAVPYSASKLAKEGSPERAWLIANLKSVEAAAAATTVERVIDKRGRAHRLDVTENRCDKLAVGVIKGDQALFDALRDTSPGALDRLRAA